MDDKVNSTTNKNMFYGASPILFDYAKKLRMNLTSAEEFLWQHLSNKQILNQKFRLQHPVLFFIADFYCHKIKLIIEVDGGYHNKTLQFQYDKNRDEELEALGLKVIRFTNNEVLFNIEQTIERIKNEIKLKL